MTPICEVLEEIVPQMVTIKRASELTGLSYNYLRTLCIRNRIVYVRAGNKYLINFPRLIEFLNTGDGGTNDEAQ